MRLCVAVAMVASLVAVPGSAMAVVVMETEPNGTAATANALSVDGTIVSGAYTPADWDYFAVALTAGVAYVFETGPSLADPQYSDTYLHLYGTDGTTQIISNDDGGPGLYSYITYTPSVSGTYYIATRHFSSSSSGVYGLRVIPQAEAPEEGTISGTVTDGTSPLEGILVIDSWIPDAWFGMGEFTDWSSSTFTTGPDGTFSFTASGGVHRIEFFDPSGEFMNEVYDGASYLMDGTDILIDGNDVTGIDAVLEPWPPVDTLVTDTVRASVSQEGIEGTNGSRSAAISADGRYVAFYTGAVLLDSDENGERDVYVRDNETGELEIVSVSSTGEQQDNGTGPDDSSWYPTVAISADGRFVAFDSLATNLVDGDVDGYMDVFAHDRQTGDTVRVSADLDGEDGNGDSVAPAISADGRFVAFDSWASDLVEGDNNDTRDVFVYDMESGSSERVSVDESGIEGEFGSRDADVSADGRHIAFVTGSPFDADDTNRSEVADATVGTLAEGFGGQDVYVKDMETGDIVRVSESFDNGDTNGFSGSPSINGDGRYVAFYSEADNVVENDTNESADVFVRDLETETTVRVSVASDGSEAYGWNWAPDISADGMRVVFTSNSDGLVVGDHNGLLPGPQPTRASARKSMGEGLDDVILHDLVTGETTLVSVASDGMQGNAPSDQGAISGDGRYVAYDSYADNLVEDDTNGVRDVFLSDLHAAATLDEPLSGDDRYRTALDISRSTFETDTVTTVVIATGKKFPDALGGSALAGAVDGPVLLTLPDELIADVADEIERLGATEAYVLGGERALSADVFADLEALLGADMVTRIGGLDRYETAELVADEVVALQGESFDGTAFVATGEVFADALAAAPLAAANGWPVYLAAQPVISADTISAMQVAGVSDVILLGGEAAMPADTAVVVLAAGFSAVRIDGADRYETAAKVAAYGVSDAGLSWDNVALATGENYADALSGGAAQGHIGSVMLLTQKDVLPTATATALTDNKNNIYTMRFFGGTAAISQAVRDAAMDLVW